MPVRLMQCRQQYKKAIAGSILACSLAKRVLYQCVITTALYHRLHSFINCFHLMIAIKTQEGIFSSLLSVCVLCILVVAYVCLFPLSCWIPSDKGVRFGFWEADDLQSLHFSEMGGDEPTYYLRLSTSSIWLHIFLIIGRAWSFLKTSYAVNKCHILSVSSPSRRA